MSPQDTTKLVLITTIIVLCLYDTYVIWNYGPQASISEVVVAQTKENPVIALAAGLLCGHLFWRM